MQQIKERGALPMIDRGDIRQAIDRCSKIWASLPGAGYGRLEHKADSPIAKNSKKRAERSERLMYEQSHRDYSCSGYLHHRLPGHGLLITGITPLPAKPSDKNARELKLANAAITDMQMRQRDVAAPGMQNGDEGVIDAKAEK